MTIKLKHLSGKSFIKLHRTIKKIDHVKKSSNTDKEIFFKNKEIKFLFEELLGEIDSEFVREEYRYLPDDYKKDLIWNHHLNLEKNSLLSINIDYKNKNLLKELANLHQILTLNCICIIKKFESNKGIKKLLQILINCLNYNCKEQDIILSTLKCLKSFGNNRYGIKRLCENDEVYEVLCLIICQSHGEECTMALDLLSVMCLINQNACEKIICWFTKINKNQFKDRFRPLIVCLMNQNKITIQRSVMCFINTMLHSVQEANGHSVQVRLQLRKELYNLGFETYLKAYRQSDDNILCHQADIFLNSRDMDKEDVNFEFLKLQNQFSSLSACQAELNRLIKTFVQKESSVVNLFHLLVFLLSRSEENVLKIIILLKRKLLPSLDDSDLNCNEEESLSNRLCMINLQDDLYVNEEIAHDLGGLILSSNTGKSSSSVSNTYSEDNELINTNRLSLDGNRDSQLSPMSDGKISDSFNGSEADLNSLLLEDMEFMNGTDLKPESLRFSLDRKKVNRHHSTCSEHEAQNLRTENSFISPKKTNFLSTSSFPPSPLKSFSEVNLFSVVKVPPTNKSITTELSLEEKENDSSFYCANSFSPVTTSSEPRSKTDSLDQNPPFLPVTHTLPNSSLPSISYFPSGTLSSTSAPQLSAPPPPSCLPPPPPPPPGPPPLPSSFKVPGKSHLRESVKRINVTLVSEQNVKNNSVWSTMMNGSYLNDQIIEKVYDRFSSKKSTEVKRKTIKPLIVLDPKSAQNIEIFLRSINMKVEILMEAVREMNVTSITFDMITKFMKYIPDQEPLKKLEPFKNRINELRTCEQFLTSLMAVNNYKIRLQCMKFQILINTNYLSGAEDNLNLVGETLDLLLTNNRFKSLLEMILFLVKVMNPNKKVFGVSIDSLPKLIDTKDNRNGNLLQFIVEQLLESKPDVLELWNDLHTLDKAVSVSAESINSVINQFSSCLTTVQTGVDQLEYVTYKLRISENIDYGKRSLLHLKQLQSEVDSKYTVLRDYLSICQADYNFENLFRDLKQFKLQFINALKQVTERKELDALQKSKLETRNRLKQEQIQRSDQLASILSCMAHEQQSELNSKSFFKPDTLIDQTIIGISSGKIFCDENAVLNWDVKFHRKENHRNRSEIVKNRLKHITPSRTRKIDASQFVTIPSSPILNNE